MEVRNTSVLTPFSCKMVISTPVRIDLLGLVALWHGARNGLWRKVAHVLTSTLSRTAGLILGIGMLEWTYMYRYLMMFEYNWQLWPSNTKNNSIDFACWGEKRISRRWKQLHFRLGCMSFSKTWCLCVAFQKRTEKLALMNRERFVFFPRIFSTSLHFRLHIFFSNGYSPKEVVLKWYGAFSM